MSASPLRGRRRPGRRTDHIVSNDSDDLEKLNGRRPPPVQIPCRGVIFRMETVEWKMVEEKGFEPSTPTLRTWCSPS
jgi:hypothetical protein